MEEQVHNAWKIQDNAILLDPNISNQPYSISANGQKMMNYTSTAYSNIISGSHSKAYTFSKYLILNFLNNLKVFLKQS